MGKKSMVQQIFSPLADEIGRRGLEFVGELQRQMVKRSAELDAYQVLGVSPEDPPDLVRSVYNAKVKYLHPDNRDTGDEERFKQVQRAYEAIIADRGRRRDGGR